jgi:hypothetical protein
LKTPVIYGVHPVESAYAGNQNMVALITSVVRSRDVIAGLHLDHSPTFDKVVECIRDGYISVMFDGSTLPLEQNLQLTRDVVRGGPTGRGASRPRSAPSALWWNTAPRSRTRTSPTRRGHS